jgi:tRNA G37 N-methylase Trm5
MSDDQQAYVDMVHIVRQLMEQGKLDEAIKVDRKATTLLRDVDDAASFSKTEVVDNSDELSKSAQLVDYASFVRPHSLLSEDEVKKTFEIVKEHPEKLDCINDLQV